MIKETVKIEINKPNLSFGDRERVINVGIQKKIDEFQTKGFVTVEHTILNKTESFATVSFVLKPMRKV
jgi:hypothetical protein